MATAEEISQQIIDHVVSSLGDNTFYGKDHYANSFGNCFGEFVDGLSWRNAEITLPAGVATLAQDVGGEDEGSHRHAVIEVNGQYFRADGSYTSWDGDDWDYATLYEVEPVNVTVIEYKRKDSNGI